MSKVFGKKKKVYTTGVFDLIHPGHVNILYKAKKFGDYLVVGVQGDDSVFKQKGKFPILSQDERKEMLESLNCVDEVFIYNSLNQIRNYKKIKPNIVVQGSDWDASDPRKTLKKFLSENKIALKLIPYTEGVSTTKLRSKIFDEQLSSVLNRGHASLKKKLKIISINDIEQYEYSDSKRVVRIAQSIKEKNSFHTPVIVAKFENRHILIDGANRIKALESLGADKVFCHVVDYTNTEEVVLDSNEHYLETAFDELKKEFESKGFKILSKKPQSLTEIKSLARIISNKEEFFVYHGGINNSNSLVDKMNSFVSVYNKKSFFRASEIQDFEHNNIKTVIYFNKIEIATIVSIIDNQLMLPTGVTWHKIKERVINFNFNFNSLLPKNTLKKSNTELSNAIKEKQKHYKIRSYAGILYICNEYE